MIRGTSFTKAKIRFLPVLWYDDDFKRRRLHTAWDNLKDEERLFAGLEALTRRGQIVMDAETSHQIIQHGSLAAPSHFSCPCCLSFFRQAVVLP